MIIKRYTGVIVCLLCLSLNVVIAQVPANKPNNSTTAADTVYPVPANYPSNIKLNFVRTHDVLEPMTDISSVESHVYNNTRHDSKVREGTVYFDGLGRKLQTVQRMFPMSYQDYQDLVTPVIYDEFGREAFQYLPFPTFNSGGAYGKFNTAPFSTQKYVLENLGGALGGPFFPGEQVFYGKTEFENSPLNRVLKSMPAGNSWAGSGVGTSFKYMINVVADSVRIWNIDNDPLTYVNGDNGTNIPETSGMYSAGQLFKNVTIDEHNNAIVEYKDKQGLVVLKKVQIGTVASDFSGYDGWLCTYYVYDDFGQLRFVIPPKATTIIKPDWQIDEEVTQGLCFRYEYDERNRMTAKKVPGSGWVYMVYDSRDRLVFSQDANMRGKDQWMTTLYDELNRPVMTGIISYEDDRDELQEYLDEQLAGTFTLNASMPQAGALYVSERDPGQEAYTAAESISFTEFESESDAEFTAEITSESPQTQAVQVSGPALPPLNNFIALTITHYDDYEWNNAGDKQFSNVHNSKLSFTSEHFTRYLDAVPSQQSCFTSGLVTGVSTRVLENPDSLEAGSWLTTVNYYDDKGRVVQTQSDNYKGGIDTLTSRYDFKGLVYVTYQVHHNPAAGNDRVRIKTQYEYNHNDQLYEVSKQLNDTGSLRLVASQGYTYLGQLQNKILYKSGGSSLHNTSFSYNIRGWMIGMNKDYLADNPSQYDESYFGMELSYDAGFANNQLNGNIAGMKWRSRGDGERRAYGFGYDKANRILSGDFSQHSGSAYVDNSNINFDMMMGDGVNPFSAYDANGNIRAMKQWGLKVNSSQVIDKLQYNYYSNSNQLKNVIDSSNDVNTKLGDFRTSQTYMANLDVKTEEAIDYEYDVNGNMVMDLNKDIFIQGGESTYENPNGGIIYNHLNLPSKVGIHAKGYITCIYDAAGNKLEKRVEEAGKEINATSYLSGFVYENDKLQFFGHEEGRVRLAKKYFLNGDSANQFVYDFFLKDHLGNVRMVLTEQQDTSQYVATMETPYRAKEEKLFFNIPESEYPAANVPGGYPTETSVTNPNLLLSKLNGSGQKIGPSLVLKVMSGDKIDIGVKSFYRPQGSPGSNSDPLQDILTVLAGGIVGSSGESKGTASDLSNPSTSPLLAALNGFRSASNPDQPGKPKAYLNWILLDEQFKHVASYPQSGAIPVGSADVINTLGYTGMEVTKNGYLYIYVSNETQNWDVFFDNLSVKHYSGPLVEETHYYPFGLTMAGISSKALKPNYAENKYKFNDGNELQSKEFNDGSGLEMYDATFRTYDPQIGRFHQTDPLADMFEGYSPYVFAFNNPVLLNDPLGLAADTTVNPVPVSPPPSCEDCPTGRMAETKELPAVIVSAKKTEKSYKWYEFFNDHNPGGDFLYELNKWNPLAIGLNAGKGYLTGTDTYGVEKSDAEAITDVVGLAAGPILRIGNVVISAGTRAFKHSYKYSSRVRVRALEEPVSHNFPYSFDDLILSAKPVIKNNGYKIYQVAGSMNGKEGLFEIGVTIEGIIDHRFFRPY